MDLSAIAAASTQTADVKDNAGYNGQSIKSAKELSGNYTMFLKLLTSQLQNQDPLSPTDATTFTSQLVSYSQVEQAIKTNDNLQSLIGATKSGSTALLGYLDKFVEVETDKLELQDGNATLTFELEGEAQKVVADILNSDGVKVASFSGAGKKGVQAFGWDGKTENGDQLDDGTYTIQLKATNALGENVPVLSQGMIARVTGLERTEEGVLLNLGNGKIAEETVINVYNSPADKRAS